MTHYVILGASAAALTALEWIRQRDRSGPVTVITKEPTVAYSRVALPYYLSGKKDLRQITLQPDEYFTKQSIDYRVGVGATGVDPAAKTVILDDGSTVNYDRLLVATGSESRVPPIQGIESAYVSYHWTLADADRIAEATKNAKKVVVVGAGFISLLTITALIHRPDLEFTNAEIAEQVMPQLLDHEASSILQARMEAHGVNVVLGDSATKIEMLKGARGGVTMKSGRVLAADAVIIGAGVKANVDFLRGGQLQIDRGILVDRQMRTNLPDVFAAGDCAETHDFLSGERVVHAIWPTAIEQGRIAGANMTGESREYPGSLSMNVTELFGLACASVGEFRDRPGLEAIAYRNDVTGLYRKMLLNPDGTIQGVVAVGKPEDMQDIGVVQHMIRTKKNVAPFREHLAKERINYGRLVHTRAGVPLSW